MSGTQIQGVAPSGKNVAISSTEDGKLVVSVASPSESDTNWATTYAYTNGQISRETRTAGAVTQTRAYGYDGSGNLVSIGAWA